MRIHKARPLLFAGQTNSGRPCLITDHQAAFETLRALAAAFDPGWDLKTEVQPQHHAELLAAIGVFKMPAVGVRGKFKMSQNRSAGERTRIGTELMNQPQQPQSDTAAQAAGRLVLALHERDSAPSSV